MSANTFHGIGIRFDNGYKPEGLARILEFVKRHQNSFVAPPNLGQQGLLQIPTPTEEESAAAVISINEAILSSPSRSLQASDARPVLIFLPSFWPLNADLDVVLFGVGRC